LGAIISGCGAGNINPGTSLDVDKDSAILLIGVSPKYRIQLLRGEMESDIWVRPTVDTPEINALPENGYILAKAIPTKANEPMGVSLIFPENIMYKPCMNSMGPVFDIKPGVINYVGDIEYVFDGKKLEYSVKYNRNKAIKFLKDNYSFLEENFHEEPIKLKKVRSNCDPIKITIPIYVPAAR